MPDWTYHPLLRPAGIKLHGEGTRALTLSRLRAIGSSPAGRWLIRFLGHMSPSEGVAVEGRGVRFASPVIFGSAIDPGGRAAQAFSQFEFGALEVGADAVAPRNGVPLLERYEGDALPSSSLVRTSVALAPSLIAEGRDVFVDWSGVVPDGAVGVVLPDASVDEVRQVKASLPEGVLLMAGDPMTPEDAVALRRAGADLLLVGEGLTKSGPGLPKRINEALVAETADLSADGEPLRQWVAGSMFGLGIVIAGLIAVYVASTSVILAYDEAYVGMAREQFNDVNAKLLDFMAHDRLSYAGATLSLGVLYTALALFGIRHRERWAFHTFVASGLAGFSTLLLFIGFRYFDIGNAAVHAVLWPVFLLAVIKPPKLGGRGNALDVVNDRVWRRGLVGQLLFVCMSIGLIIGGLTITIVGSVNVFVISDLHYLGTTSEALLAANERILPLVAHDRVTFGGAIVCNGLAALLMAMWGFHRGEAWIWWTFLLAGSVNLGFTCYAHFVTGYTEFGHMLPVAIGAAFFVAGLMLSRRYLLAR